MATTGEVRAFKQYAAAASGGIQLQRCKDDSLYFFRMWLERAEGHPESVPVNQEPSITERDKCFEVGPRQIPGCNTEAA
jgi:hypothetical protein